MKVIHVKKPTQICYLDQTDDSELDMVEYIENEHGEKERYVPEWMVRSEMLKHNETFNQWVERKEEQIVKYRNHKDDRTREKYGSIDGIYFYDIQALTAYCNDEVLSGMIIRYDYIMKKRKV